MNDSEIRKNIEMKKKKHQQQVRRTRFLALLVLLGLIVLIVIICSIVGMIKGGKSSEPEIIVNEYIYPPAPEITADLLTAMDIADGIKTCYLTFDDGPTESVTPQILDVLRKYNVKATFFTVGSLLEANPDIARRTFDEGHLLANHTYAHNYSKLYSDETTFMNELNSTYSLIQKITGIKNYPKVFRFPGGGYNSGKYGAIKQEFKIVLKNNNIRYCDWNALNGDAEGGTPTAQKLIERTKSSSEGKEDIVILMHDAATKATTAESLPAVIEYLIEQGYTFKRLDDVPLV